MDSQHLLVPIKVQALVIDDIVIKRSGVVKTPENQYVANAGRWSPLQYDYQPLRRHCGIAPGEAHDQPVIG